MLIPDRLRSIGLLALVALLVGPGVACGGDTPDDGAADARVTANGQRAATATLPMPSPTATRATTPTVTVASPTAEPTATTTSSPVTTATGLTGRIVFERDGEIYAVNPDGSGLTNLTNNPARDSGAVPSPDGRRVAFVSDRDVPPEQRLSDFCCYGDLYVMAADGSAVSRLTTNTEFVPDFSWSPDGTRVVYSIGMITIVNADGTGATNLVAGYLPVWFPSGVGQPERIAFSTPWGVIAVMNADGSNVRELSIDANSPPAWSPDGRYVAFTRSHGDKDDIFVVRFDDGSERQLTDTPDFKGELAWSPDGSTIAFRVGAGDGEIYTVDVKTGAVSQLTTTGGYGPAWSPDGRHLGYRAFDGGVYRIRSDGSEQMLLADGLGFGPPVWSP